MVRRPAMDGVRIHLHQSPQLSRTVVRGAAGGVFTKLEPKRLSAHLREQLLALADASALQEHHYNAITKYRMCFVLEITRLKSPWGPEFRVRFSGTRSLCQLRLGAYELCTGFCRKISHKKFERYDDLCNKQWTNRCDETQSLGRSTGSASRKLSTQSRKSDRTSRVLRDRTNGGEARVPGAQFGNFDAAHHGIFHFVQTLRLQQAACQ